MPISTVRITSREIVATLHMMPHQVGQMIASMASKGWIRPGVIRAAKGRGIIDFERDYELTFMEAMLFCIHSSLDAAQIKSIMDVCNQKVIDAYRGGRAKLRDESEKASRERRILLAKRVRLALLRAGVVDEQNGIRACHCVRAKDGIVRLAPSLSPLVDAAADLSLTPRDVADVICSLPGGLRIGPQKFYGKLARAVSISEAELMHFIATAASW